MQQGLSCEEDLDMAHNTHIQLLDYHQRPRLERVGAFGLRGG